ncbi:hypothetical protein [Shewanella schlegeliana]|nr:hypothetical protein [Shewanella schlegeliana]
MLFIKGVVPLLAEAARMSSPSAPQEAIPFASVYGKSQLKLME